jgi:hypothetical protein
MSFGSNAVTHERMAGWKAIVSCAEVTEAVVAELMSDDDHTLSGLLHFQTNHFYKANLGSQAVPASASCKECRRGKRSKQSLIKIS